ncbi:MAG: hypothetical protein P4L55_09120 [Syntrophobacteraceae bacterium]|nr:hypothetical protein [Syntrophobacteraceae bacterium]
MLIVNKKTMSWGLLLGVSFMAILVLIFSPVWGQGRNGLNFSDRLFNSLAKGSAYFIPEVTENLKKFEEQKSEKQQLVVSVKMKSPEEAAAALKVLSKSAPNTTAQSAVLKVETPLAPFLGAALRDADLMYLNKGAEVSQKYGMDEKKAMLGWYDALKGASKALQRAGHKEIVQSKMIEEVMTRAIEPAYNFYKIPAERVGPKALLLTGLLIFYIVYTLWWGFAIYFLCDGLGLSMTKAKAKKEV